MSAQRRIGSRVHFTGYPEQTGTVKSVRNAVKSARGGGRSFQRTTKALQYFVDWDNGDPSGWYYGSETINVPSDVQSNV
jgi:hypothetical protein